MLALNNSLRAMRLSFALLLVLLAGIALAYPTRGRGGRGREGRLGGSGRPGERRPVGGGPGFGRPRTGDEEDGGEGEDEAGMEPGEGGDNSTSTGPGGRPFGRPGPGRRPGRRPARPGDEDDAGCDREDGEDTPTGEGGGHGEGGEVLGDGDASDGAMKPTDGDGREENTPPVGDGDNGAIPSGV